MPPARKKRGAAAAAAAAAKAAQWKVGDLVLAKMKGFPAWPAVISKPEQFGVDAVKKKLLVYFYGTEEIAFCNYANLEAFTEEKKKNLLVKRHGKGADFVRAVKEIVDMYDSLKKESSSNNKSGLTKNNVRTDDENHVNNSSNLDTGGSDDCSDLANDNKMEDCPTSSMNHSMVNGPGPHINTIEGEHSVVNSAHDDPIEKLSILDLDELRHSPLHASPCSKKRQKDSHPNDSCTQGFVSPHDSGSSLGAKLRTNQDSSGMMNGTSLPSVDLVPCDEQEDSALHKCINDDKLSPYFPSATKEIVLPYSSQGSCSQLVASGANNDDEEPNNATDMVYCTCSNEVPQTGVRDKEVEVNGMLELPMNTTRTFRRKRRPNTNHADIPAIGEVTDTDEELQPMLSENIVDTNSTNEINKSDGDGHLPLVKRARVRKERPLLENATVDKPDDSYNKTKPVNHADRCYKHHMVGVSGKDQSGDELPHGVDSSPKMNLSVPSEVQVPCMNNKEYQLKVSTLDVEAVLPPSKRLHRALEAMSAYASETICNLQVTESKEVVLKGCTDATMPPSNNSADALVDNPNSSVAKSPEVSLSAHSLDGPGQNHISQLIMLNKDVLSTISPDLKNDASDSLLKDKVCEEAIMDNENIHDLVVSDMIVGDFCGKAPTCSLKPEEPSFVSMFDQPASKEASANWPMKSIEGSSNVFGKSIDGSAESVSQANAIVTDPIGTCKSIEGSSNVFGKSIDGSAEPVSQANATVSNPFGTCKSIKGSSNVFGKSIDGSAEPVSEENAIVSDTSGTCNPIPHDDTILPESIINVCDRTSASSLVSKVSCVHSDASTRTFEAHSSSVIAQEELGHRSNLKDKSLDPDPMSMKELATDLRVRRLYESNSFMDSSPDSKVISESLVNVPSLKEVSNGWCSPSNRMMRSASDRVDTQPNGGNISFDDLHPKGLYQLAGRNEVSAARRAFETFVGTLTRTKESISRATRLALECAKHGIAGEVMDIIIEHLEKETDLYKRVDLFFLVDSIIRYCRSQKGGPGDVYPSLIQAVLPRIIYASAPPGNSAWENRRQCLKVLRLWLERKTLSEYIIRHHIKELEILNEASFGSSHRPSGTERALNDPLRDDEAFLVDEYGSNAGFHLPNLICTLLEDEDGKSSEERRFEALTSEHDIIGANEQEASQLHVVKHQLVLEEVDGELEMEDAAPSTGPEASSACQEGLTNHASCPGTTQHFSSIPPLPDDRAPSPPPLPSSPPPVPRPSCPATQGSQVQGALLMAADYVEQHHPGAGANYNVEGQHPCSVLNNQGNMDACVASLQPPVSYNSGYSGHTNQIFPPPPPPPPPQPIALFHPSGPHGNLCGPTVPHHGNSYHQPVSAPPPNNAYHVQPPPHAPAPNQFQYPPESEQRTQPWNYGPFPERSQYGGHDRGHHGYGRRAHFDDRGHHLDDRGHHFDGGGHYFDDGMHHFDDRWHHFHDRGQMHHEVMDSGRFPPYFPPGPPFPDHFDAPPTQLHYERPLDPATGPCSGWSMPHRRSKYPPDSEHSMEPPVSNGGWRRHGRRDYDRYH